MTILEYAQHYTKLGWVVVPVKRGTKYPALESWKEYQTRKPTEAELKEWFENKDVGIGVITGKISDLTVIDNDTYKPNAEILNLDVPIMALSGAGGRHYFQKYNPQVSTFKNEEKSVDSRSEGGFIVLPPTTHPTTGKEYMWLTDLPTQVQVDQLQVCPSEMEKYRLVPKGEKVELSSLVGVKEGGRDDSLLRMADSLIFRGIPQEQVYFILSEVNKTYKPPLEDKDVLAKLRQAVNFKSASELTTDNGHPYKGSQGLSVVNFSPVWLKEMDATLEEITWLWEGFLAKGCLTLFSALWKSGKSTLITHVIKKMATGESLAGMTMNKSKVLIVSEEGKGIWVERREDLNLEGDIAILSKPLQARLKYPEWVTFIDQISLFCIEQDIDVVIFDTISAFWSVNNENDASEVGAALLPLNKLTAKNISVMLVHHFRKSGGEEATASRGSGALGAAVDIIMDFKRFKDDPDSNKRVIKTYSRFRETPIETVIELDEETEEYKTLGTSGEVRQTAKINNILNIFKEFPNGAITTDIYDNWDDDEMGARPSARTIRRMIKTLPELEVIGEKLVGKKKTNIYKLTADKTRLSLIGMSAVNEANSLTDDTVLSAVNKGPLFSTEDSPDEYIDPDDLDKESLEKAVEEFTKRREEK